MVEDGVEALRYFFGGDGLGGCPPENLPAVVLLDLKLPRVDGLEVLRRMRADEKTKRVPVVVLTSSNEDKDVIACYNLGANSYVRKPVRLLDFAEAIRLLVLYWLTVNKPAPDGTQKS